ncbi:FtsQ-type POTRA domain-containing protein [Sedimentibacter sp. zth1]|uniref:cell division protein FtsQ/DivIB n=1 Tax=Sedimentibacter sp. zth1 TaxID=2816908 RepID=UPI001A92D087|nr:FtsQ-type POTRA domain-containing protein [Sedimentibacter sp. zth1]QSX06153.1 FtsQ-type POTRA domain-containing protein [Sedimentibacter sp. zth1]
MGRKRRKKKVKRKVNKLYISTVAILLATVTVVFCTNYIKNRTDIFNIEAISIINNTIYSDDYIISKASIQLGKKIFDIDRDKIEETIEKEIYVKKCKVVYQIPNKVCINIEEREEKYLISYNDDILITDSTGTVLDGNKQNNELFPIESKVNIIYNIGDKVNIEGLINFEAINGLLEFSEKLDDIDKTQKLCIYEDNVIGIDTKYGLHVKMKLDDEIQYNYYFALALIKDRLQKNQEVIGCNLDFTKGDSPVFTFGLKREGN